MALLGTLPGQAGWAVFAVTAMTSVSGAAGETRPPPPAAPAIASARGEVRLREYQVKAMFLFNFTRFVDWPDKEKGQPVFTIGVLGEDPFGFRLDRAVQGEQVNGRTLVVKRLRHVEEALTCDALFIAGSERPRLAGILARVSGRPILTVSDIPEFAEAGGMVELVSAEGKIRLKINVDVAKSAHLALSSKLLRPAQIVSTRKSSRNGPFRATHLISLRAHDADQWGG